MNIRTSRARTLGAVGAVLAAGTTTFLALTTGTASAAETGRCTDNVNVREDPDSTSRIVALCKADTQVALGEERDGFVRLDELGGWASTDFVKADGAGAATDAADSGDDATTDAATTDEPGSDADAVGGRSSGDASDADAKADDQGQGASDGASQDGTAQDGTAQDGKAQDDKAQDDKAQDGKAHRESPIRSRLGSLLSR